MIDGPDWDGAIIASNVNYTYSIEPFGSGATYNWVTEPPLIIVSGQGSNSVTVKGCSSSLTTAELSVYASTSTASCYNDGEITIQPGSCVPPPPPPCTCPNPVINVTTCNNGSGYLLANVTGYQPGDKFLWTGSSNVRSINGPTSSSAAFTFYNSSQDFYIYCTVTRKCGTTTYSKKAWYASNQSTNCQYYGKGSYSCTIN